MSEKITLSGVPAANRLCPRKGKQNPRRAQHIKQNHGFKTELIKSFKRKSIS